MALSLGMSSYLWVDPPVRLKSAAVLGVDLAALARLRLVKYAVDSSSMRRIFRT